MKKFALIILIFWLGVVLVGRLLDLHGNTIDLSAILNTPSSHQFLGTDDLGRSIFARILRGAEVSLMVAILVTLITMTIGVIIGLLAGFYGGKVDAILMKIESSLVLTFV